MMSAAKKPAVGSAKKTKTDATKPSIGISKLDKEEKKVVTNKVTSKYKPAAVKKVVPRLGVANKMTAAARAKIELK